MDYQKRLGIHYRIAWVMLILITVSGISFAAGILWSRLALADEERTPSSENSAENNSQVNAAGSVNSGTPGAKKPRVVYPSKTKLDFDGTQIEGELHNPGDFYFEHRPEEKFDSLVKRRKNFHRQMLRDVVMSK